MMSRVTSILKYILNRFKEPSSWAGVAVFVGFFGLSPETIDHIVTNGPMIIAAIASVAAIFLPDFKPAVTVDSAGDTTETNVPVGSTVDLLEEK